MMWEQGVLEANQMAGTFDLMRSNDLIWSRAIHNYLMGEPETMDDLAAWSSDATRMPYRMHSEYLRMLYLNNDLAEGRFLLNGRPVALQDIRAPMFVIGTERDHVAPWRSVFKIHHLTDTEITFVLVNGGHNRGVVAPPGQGDRHFRIATTASKDSRPDPDAWAAAADIRRNPGGSPGSTGFARIRAGRSRPRRSGSPALASRRSARRRENMCSGRPAA
jgi:polyhydroxyalkanoate synthase